MNKATFEQTRSKFQDNILLPDDKVHYYVQMANEIDIGVEDRQEYAESLCRMYIAGLAWAKAREEKIADLIAGVGADGQKS